MTLADLIAARKGDASYETLAQRGGLSTAAMHKFAVGNNKDFPPPATVLGLAQALQVSVRDVVTAAAYGLGLEMRDDSGTPAAPALGRLLPAEVDQLPAHAQRAIVDMATAMVALMYGDDPETDPAKVAGSAARQRDAAVADLSDRRAKRDDRRI